MGHIRARRAFGAGMFNPSGAFVPPYDSITDAFASDSGLWLDGALAAAAMTIASGKGIWTPALAATELLTNGDMEAGDPPTEWSALSSVISSDATAPHGGSKELKAVISGAGGGFRQNFSTALGKWLHATIWTRLDGNSFDGITIYEISGTGQSQSEDTLLHVNYIQHRITILATTATMQLLANRPFDTGTQFGDDGSVKAITDASLVRVQRIYYPSTVAAKIWTTPGCSAGVVLYSDANNYIAAIHNGINLIRLIKVVSGTPTYVVAVDVNAYSAGALLQLIPNATFDAFSVNYGGAEVIASQSITNWAALTGQWYAGILKTYNSTSISADAFDDFAAARVESASPFQGSLMQSFEVASTATVVSSDAPLDWNGRPVMEVVNGVVVMVYYRAQGHGGGDGALHIRFSSDYATWSDEDKTLLGASVTNFPMNPPDLADGQSAEDPYLMIAPNGNLLLHMWKNSENPVDHDGSYQSVSTDDGITWSTPVATNITGMNAGDLPNVFTTGDHFVYGGTIYLCGRNFAPGHKVILLKSADNGVTWEFVSDICTTANDGTECGIEYIGDNTILAIIRIGDGTGTGKAISTDMGETWGAMTNITAAIPASGRQRIWTKNHIQGGANWWTDTELLMCGFVFVAGGGRRTALWTSPDAGATWSLPKYVDAVTADAGYGDVIYNPSTGQYVFMSYFGSLTAAVIKQYNCYVRRFDLN